MGKKNLQVVVHNTETGELFFTEEHFSKLGGFTTYEPSKEQKKQYYNNVISPPLIGGEYCFFKK